MALTAQYSLLKSEHALRALERLRAGDSISSIDLSLLSPDDRTYLESEACVRDALYSQLESRIHAGSSPWVTALAFCYRDLFTNPQQALDSLDQIEADCPSHFEFPLRLKFWRAHLNLILGKIEIGKRVLIQVTSQQLPNCLWTNEMLTIRALGLYFTARTTESIKAHHECQEGIDKTPDLFLQTFNSAMAARGALKLCDAANFEYFSQKLEESLRSKDDSRYRLRHTGYRGLIFNQLGEHELAEAHWKLGDEQFHLTQSAIERGQYFVFRGLSHALVNDIGEASRKFFLAEHELKLAGSPALYLTELDIARHLAEIANPIERGKKLARSLEVAQKAKDHFLSKTSELIYPMQEMYSESAAFCDALLKGEPISKNREGRISLVLSVVENVSKAESFVKGISHFRLIPKFVHSIAESDLSGAGLSNSLEKVMGIKPLLSDDKFTLPGQCAKLEDEPEIAALLEFASTIFSLGKHSLQLLDAELRLKESSRAKHLLHDLRFFAAQLETRAKDKSSKLDQLKLSAHLKNLIESYLVAMKNGENPSRPTMIHFPSLLDRVSKMVREVTGIAPTILSRQGGPFLWASEGLLKRVLLNIIKNGIEAGEGPEPVQIRFGVENKNLVIKVSDNGPGIAASTFNAIRAGTEIKSSKAQGVGLGLRSAIECADELGATLDIIPNPKTTGATFRISLALPERATFDQVSNPEILVIDDSRAIHEAWVQFGVQQRVAVKCTIGADACAILNQIPPSLQWIVVDYDLKLPDCTGADIGAPLLAQGYRVALSTGFQEYELPEDVQRISWCTIIGKDPRYPEVTPRSLHVISQRPDRKVQPDSAKLRHDVKNELTPLTTAYNALISRHPDEPALPLVADAIKSLERLSKVSEKEKAT